ncbi:RxLR effector protein [Phytophthora megakarya]|uniref:RxLR effector protein n=1 Tax=Phytophthora megakarya TaxID=4795 RepID=A0A225WQU0_9STRA|nr:RxLR effector protein [Phytophthora megakarya]
MSIHFLVWLTFLVSVVYIEADALPSGPKVLRSSFSDNTKFQATIKIGISNTRLLRSKSVPENRRSEERGVTGFSIVETIRNAFKSKGIAEKLAKWQEQKIPSTTVFNSLHLDKPGQMLFTKLYFPEWVKYADKLGAKIPKMSAISILTKRYGDDILFSMIKEAKTNPRTNELAVYLEAKQIEHWLTTRKDPYELFHLFNLDDGVRRIFEQPAFTTWAQYVDDLNAKHPEKPTWMYSKLRSYLDDTILVKMIETAKASEKTRVMALKLEQDMARATDIHLNLC